MLYSRHQPNLSLEESMKLFFLGLALLYGVACGPTYYRRYDFQSQALERPVHIFRQPDHWVLLYGAGDTDLVRGQEKTDRFGRVVVRFIVAPTVSRHWFVVDFYPDPEDLLVREIVQLSPNGRKHTVDSRIEAIDPGE